MTEMGPRQPDRVVTRGIACGLVRSIASLTADSTDEEWAQVGALGSAYVEGAGGLDDAQNAAEATARALALIAELAGVAAHAVRGMPDPDGWLLDYEVRQLPV